MCFCFSFETSLFVYFLSFIITNSFAIVESLEYIGLYICYTGKSKVWRIQSYTLLTLANLGSLSVCGLNSHVYVGYTSYFARPNVPTGWFGTKFGFGVWEFVSWLVGLKYQRNFVSDILSRVFLSFL